jgi:uncharacterized protein
MTEAHVHQSHPDIVKRLKRAEGHMRRVIAMLLQAVEKAISEAKRRLIHDHVDHCLDVAANGAGAARPQIVSEFKAISRYL